MVQRATSRLAVIVLCASQAGAQTPNDGDWRKEHTPTKRVVPYPHIREADVLWHRRVWRTIDLQEKMNHPLYYPIDPILDRQSLFDVIKDALLVEGSLTAYDVGVIGQYDEFTRPLLSSELRDIFLRSDTSWTEDIITGEMVMVVQEIRTESQDIMQYHIKEDWIFDKQRSEVDVRIIGIAPMKEMRGSVRAELTGGK